MVYDRDHERPCAAPAQLQAVPDHVSEIEPRGAAEDRRALRLLVVDDQPNLRMLLRTTFEIVDVDVDEAGTAAEAERRIEAQRPDVIVLDVALPDVDGITFCRTLKADPKTADIPVVLLTGTDASDEDVTGAEAFVRKPFSPLDLLEMIERLAGRLPEGPYRLMVDERPDEQLLLYAQDLRRLLEVERVQRSLIQSAYEETVTALATRARDQGRRHRRPLQRVVRYALQLAEIYNPQLLDDPGLEYGFLLHDIGKIGIPDGVLQKRGPLTDAERGVIQTHTVLGQQILSACRSSRAQGLAVVRSHHERWDGTGYPDRLREDEIPIGARIFAIADSLDAMTTNRPYRKAGPWTAAVERSPPRPPTSSTRRSCETFRTASAPALIYEALGAG